MQNPERQNQSSGSIQSRRPLAHRWHWTWLILLVIPLAAGATFLISLYVKPVYRTTSTILVSGPPSSATSDEGISVVSDQILYSYAQMITDGQVLRGVEKQSGITNLDPRSITAQVVKGTQLITISVESTDPKLAVNIANSLGIVFAGYVRAIKSDQLASSLTGLQNQVAVMSQKIATTDAQLALDAPNSTQALQDQRVLDLYLQLYSNLVTNLEQMKLAADQTTLDVAIPDPAGEPELVRPRPILNAALAGLAALLLVGGVAFILLIISLVNALLKAVKIEVSPLVGQRSQGEPQNRL